MLGQNLFRLAPHPTCNDMGVLTGADRSYQHTATACSVRHRGHRVAETHPIRSATAVALRCSTLSGTLRHPATDTWHVTTAATFCLLPRTCILGDVVSDLGAPQGTQTAFRFSHPHLKERSGPFTYSAACFRAPPKVVQGARDPQTSGEESWGGLLWGEWCQPGKVARWRTWGVPSRSLGSPFPLPVERQEGNRPHLRPSKASPASVALASGLTSLRLDFHFWKMKVGIVVVSGAQGDKEG